MEGTTADEAVRIRANSPGKYPILIIELPAGDLRAVYFDTGYDPGRAKPVGEGWLQENAIGRHSFVEVNPPVETTAGALGDYVRREILGGS